MTTPHRPIINLNAGPAALPIPVLEQAARATVDLDGTGISILSISHRSPEFEGIVANANADLCALLGVPVGEYAVLWMQGGASTQFHTVAINLAARAHGLLPPTQDNEEVEWAAEYLVTGTWSQKALETARAAGIATHVIADSKPANYTSVPAVETWSRAPRALYTYVCTNETVHGVELSQRLIDAAAAHPATANGHRPLLVADMSSNILSRPVNVSQYDLIFAGAQKNMGPAGVTLAIVRKSVLNVKPDMSVPVPLMLDYATYAASNSLYNTPPVHAMFVTGLVLRWLREADHGMAGETGLAAISARNNEKAYRVYTALREARYFAPIVSQEEVQSHMNVVFHVLDDEERPKPELEKKFVKFAEGRGIVGLAGHRSVGGCRASLYNAVTLEDTDALVSCIREFDRLL
ncbi:phosphoserine aminotransferase [Blastocladiella britannica]|nr:phosphoserine aminotransferase [Blastocladiella britannica]